MPASQRISLALRRRRWIVARKRAEYARRRATAVRCPGDGACYRRPCLVLPTASIHLAIVSGLSGTLKRMAPLEDVQLWAQGRGRASGVDAPHGCNVGTRLVPLRHNVASKLATAKRRPLDMPGRDRLSR